MEMMYKVKFGENFKDGMILGGRFFAAGTIAIISEMDAKKIQQSGGLIEIQERMVPNPLKKVEVIEEPEPQQEKPIKEISSYKDDETQPVAQPKKETKVKRGKSTKK